MKSSLLGIIFFLTTANFSSAQLIISEYLKGASNDKCIELYNPTGASINLSTYSIKKYSNGASSPTSTITLSGTIASCGTFVLCHGSASQSSDQTSNSLDFNGDDAIALFNGGTVIDIFGSIGVDPGSAWTGVGAGTANDGFIRNASYCSGVTTNPGGSGVSSFTTFTTANWTSVGQSGATLGGHTSNCGSCGTPITNTITINSVSSLSYVVDCATGAAGTINITTTETFSAGNIYTVQLSDATGSFTTPTIIGSLVSTSNGPLDINFSIPSGTASGSGYRIRVVSSTPSVASANNGSDITITLTGSPCVLEPPHMTSVIINSCNPTCNEGYNEIVFGTSGGYSIDVTVSNFNFEYGSNPSPSSNTNYTDVLVNNPTRITELDAAAGCPGLFVDAVGATIPPNASWMLAFKDICEEALDWTGLCGSGPIYVIFQDDPNWNTGGNFVNSSGGLRYLNTNIKTTSNDVFDIDYNFNSNTYSNSDGVFVTYDSNGGAPVLYGDDDCFLDPVVLPIELYSFTGEIQNQASLLNWTTITEYNFSHFNIYHATDVTSFYKIASVAAAGNTELKQSYRMTHLNPVPGVNYYRLSAIDNNGTERNHGMIALRVDIHFAYFNGNSIILDAPYSIEIYNLQGQLIVRSNDETTIPFNQKGIFILREIESGTTQKIVIQ